MLRSLVGSEMCIRDSLQAEFHLNVFIVSPSGGQKPQFWTNFDFWRFLHRPPFTDDGEICFAIADPQCTFMCQNSPRSVYSVALWRRKTQFVLYFGFRHLLMSTVGLNLRKLNTGAQLKIFPYLTASKSFLYSQRLYGEIGRTNSDVQKRDGQTKKSTFIANPAADEIHAPPNLAR